MFLLRLNFFILLSYTSSFNVHFIASVHNGNDCFMERDDLLKLLDLFNVKSNVLKVKIITKDYNNDFQQFVQDYFNIIYELHTTLIIENYFNDSVRIESRNLTITTENVRVNLVNGMNSQQDKIDEILEIRTKNNEQFVANNETNLIARKIQNVIFVLTHNEELLTNNVELFAEKPRTTLTIILLANCLCKTQFYEEYLRNLWQKFKALNVLFVAKCSKVRLFTYNPFTSLKEYFQIDLNDLRTIKLDKLNNLYRYELRTSIFVRSPTAIKLKDVPSPLKTNPIYLSLRKSFNFAGYDGYVLANLADYMNFTLNLTSVSDQSNYGRIVKGGIHTGTLGDVAYNRIDISGNGMFYSDYDGSGLIEFTIPVNNDKLCVVVPKAQEIPQWIKMFRCFKPKTWLILFAICTICIIFWVIVKDDDKKTRSELPLEIIAIFLTVSTKLSTKSSHRIFLAFCMGYTVIVTNIFQGSLVKSFSTKSYYADVDTLEELDQSGLRIATSLDIFSNRTPLLANLENKRTVLNISALDRAAFYRDVAAVERKEDANLLINTQYKREDDGYPLLHLMKKCPSSVFIAYVVPNGSPYLNRFNFILYKFSEAGLLEKWYRDVIDALIWDKLKRDSFYLNDDQKAINFNDVKAAFCLLTIGLFVGCIVLIVERRIFKNKF